MEVGVHTLYVKREFTCTHTHTLSLSHTLTRPLIMHVHLCLSGSQPYNGDILKGVRTNLQIRLNIFAASVHLRMS